jgi:hypothetical protein
MAETPPRARTRFIDGELLFLTACKECGKEFYGPAKQTRCAVCQSKPESAPSS